MNVRRLAQLSAVGICIAALGLAATRVDARQGAPSANGPLTLPGAAVPKTANPEPTPKPAPDAAPSAVLNVPPASIQPRKIENTSTEKTKSVSNETKGLGLPAPTAAKVSETEAPGVATKLNAPRLGFAGSEFIRVGGALAAVIGLALIAKIALRRAGGILPGADRPSGVVEILARYPIARGQHLILLKLARRIMLLHQSGSNMNTICELTDPDEVAALLARLEAGSSGRSAEKFKQVLRGFESEHDVLPEVRTVRSR